MKIVIPGGTGQVGGVLRRAWSTRGHEVVVLSRHPEVLEDGVRHRLWDGRTIGPWAEEIDGADVVVNLAGRTVSCRYTAANLTQMMDSRVESTRVVGEAIARAADPPNVWLQMSTATIYAHRFDAPNDEATGIIGGDEPDVPGYWEFSTRIAKHWEAEQAAAATPQTRKVALRSAMVMSPDKGGVLDVLLTMARLGLGGPVAGGEQFVSWIHERDFVRACDLLIERADISGPVNMAAPGSLPQRDLMRVLRTEAGMPIGLPATAWMAEIGAWVMRSDTELLLKSRRVAPGRLLEAGFEFELPEWEAAARDLVARARRRRNHSHRAHAGSTMDG
ncbi:TIGR01777 family oxidoreductase [Nocardioides sp. NBC_00368]|uniref:TIGR01777 family oxidoreductase n=1 Tax=Nocardioides sp. NBC_00368 TaxID=2976000 RepID=UPI002E250A1E